MLFYSSHQIDACFLAHILSPSVMVLYCGWQCLSSIEFILELFVIKLSLTLPGLVDS